jgi:hypothetical protein
MKTFGKSKMQVKHEKLLALDVNSLDPKHLGNDVDVWEAAVIVNAAYFKTAQHRGYGAYDRVELPTLREAIEVAKLNERTMIWAVSEAGRSVTVNRDDWDVMLTLISRKE